MLKSADVLHGTILACIVVGSAHHVYLLKQPFQPLLRLLLLQRLCQRHPVHLLLRRPLGLMLVAVTDRSERVVRKFTCYQNPTASPIQSVGPVFESTIVCPKEANAPMA